MTNQIAPGGATFDDFGSPSINARDQVMAIALLKNSTSRLGLFVGDGTDAVAIALDGQRAPNGGAYEDRGIIFPGTPRINDRGEVAFLARLTGGKFGMFRGNGRRTATVALAGTGAPGTNGMFESFGDAFELGNDGRIALFARLAVGVGGVDSSNNIGLWIGSSDEDLRLLARTGDVICGHVLTDVSFAGTAIGGHQMEMSQDRLLWKGSFGLAKALIVSRIPGGNDDDKE